MPLNMKLLFNTSIAGLVTLVAQTGRATHDSSVYYVEPQTHISLATPADITQKIQAELANSKSFSPQAKNVKIVIIDDELILSGPVKSHVEADKIIKIANTIAPSMYIIFNELEVIKK